MTCILCNLENQRELPDPTATRAITTAGIMVEQPLSKFQCQSCGLIQRSADLMLGRTRFYETNYETYYQRPGAVVFDQDRYNIMADWMRDNLNGLSPKKILDVGCGAGWSMRATQKLYPDAEIEGVEPSEINGRMAREAGFTVYSSRLGEKPLTAEKSPSNRYDLIYAQNVLMHVLDPVGFFSHLKSLLGDPGRILIICPNSFEPSDELLWCDHNFSFLPENILTLARLSGLKLTRWQENPDNVTILDKQLFVLVKDDNEIAAQENQVPRIGDLSDLYERRCAYLKKWQNIDKYLLAQIDGATRVLNFGSSMWTLLLAGYCPDYWSRVDACFVDGHAGISAGKDVVPLADLQMTAEDVVVLGVNPVSQDGLRARFKDEPCKVVSWGGIISR